MHSLFKLFVVGVAFCAMALSVTTAARANQFFIEDQNDRFTISFPDLWKRVGNQKTDDKLTVLAPGEFTYASCRVRVRNDRRYVIFPGKFDDAIQKTAVSHDFWTRYLGEYDDVVIDSCKDESSLGFGHASMAEVSYKTSQGPRVRKRGLMFASLYHDQLYIVDCSSEAGMYESYRPAFLSIVKSVDFGRVTHQVKSGHYRMFMDDAPVEVLGEKTLDAYKF